MLQIKNIRKIPEYMIKLIKEKDKTATQDGNVRFYKYFTKYNKELCEVTVAVRNYRKKWFCKQVIVHGIHSDKCYLQDIMRVMSYYKVGWYREGISRTSKWQDYDWGWQYDRYFNMTEPPVINKEFILTLPEYKYSAIDKYDYWDTLKYLRLYEKYPQAELLVKAGLSNLATSKQILQKCAKDKSFCKWIYKNKDNLRYKGYYVSSIVRAYNKNKTVKEIYDYDRFNLEFSREGNFTRLKQMLRKDEKETFFNYIIKQNTNGYSYMDYLNACEYLGLDMNEDKNRYPKDFKKWHDIRIDQYHTQKAIEDENARKELYTKFSNVANKYVSLERLIIKDDYICLIAKSPAELKYEGEKLNHCVGRMNYDQKFAREETLIFFIRNRLSPNTPFVTLEYSLKNHKILQCYAYGDTKPEEHVLEFVNKTWLPYANRKIKKLVA